MRKTLIVFSILIIGLMAASTAAFGFGGLGDGFRAGPHETCIMDSLSGEEQEVFMEIMTDYQDALSELRERMRDLRKEGNYEAFREAKSELFEIKEERREQLSKILPDEYKNRFESTGHHRRHFGCDRGSSGFNKQQGPRQEQ